MPESMFPLTNISGSSSWTSGIINSEEELTVIGNLIRQQNCSGQAGIGGSTNETDQTQFAFSDLYLRNTSVGKLSGVVIEYMVFLAKSCGTLLFNSYLRHDLEFHCN